jgi:hypothetical protein
LTIGDGSDIRWINDGDGRRFSGADNPRFIGHHPEPAKKKASSTMTYHMDMIVLPILYKH